MNERSGEKFSPLVRPIFIVSTMTAIKFSAASIQKAPQTAVTSVATAYPWAAEIEKTIVQSLVTTFGLDFLLFQDKIGGDVDTIFNANKGLYATEVARARYEQRGPYIPDNYHANNPNYKSIRNREQNEYLDYSGKPLTAETGRSLDHVCSAFEIHNNPGIYLAELDPSEIANLDINLQYTSRSVNSSMRDTPIDEWLKKKPRLIEDNEKELKKLEQKLSQAKSIEDINNIQKAIDNKERLIDKLKSVDEDAMRKRDAQARKEIERIIDAKYYGGTTFMKNTAFASFKAGAKMGSRQVLGLICAEIWFELKEAIPAIFEKIKSKFCLDDFFAHVKTTLKKIWQRIKMRFRDFLTEFKDGAIGGALSSVTTTIFNIFATTGKGAIKIIREMWGHLTKALKLIFFNPENLSLIDLGKAVTGVLATGVSALAGSMVYANLVPVLSFPMGGELATFAGALVTGLLTLGLNHFLLHSDLAKKAWAYLESRMPHAELLRKYKEANAEIDRYLTELGNIEFNLDLEDLASFATQLEFSENEEEKATVLKEQADKMKIDLPFEPGNSASTRKFLAGKI